MSQRGRMLSSFASTSPEPSRSPPRGTPNPKLANPHGRLSGNCLFFPIFFPLVHSFTHSLRPLANGICRPLGCFLARRWLERGALKRCAANECVTNFNVGKRQGPSDQPRKTPTEKPVGLSAGPASFRHSQGTWKTRSLVRSCPAQWIHLPVWVTHQKRQIWNMAGHLLLLSSFCTDTQ